MHGWSKPTGPQKVRRRDIGCKGARHPNIFAWLNFHTLLYTRGRCKGTSPQKSLVGCTFVLFSMWRTWGAKGLTLPRDLPLCTFLPFSLDAQGGAKVKRTIDVPTHILCFPVPYHRCQLSVKIKEKRTLQTRILMNESCYNAQMMKHWISTCRIMQTIKQKKRPAGLCKYWWITWGKGLWKAFCHPHVLFGVPKNHV